MSLSVCSEVPIVCLWPQLISSVAMWWAGDAERDSYGRDPRVQGRHGSLQVAQHASAIGQLLRHVIALATNHIHLRAQLVHSIPSPSNQRQRTSRGFNERNVSMLVADLELGGGLSGLRPPPFG